MKIAVVVRAVSFGDGIGGLERAAGDQVRTLCRMGQRIVLVSGRVHGQPPEGVQLVRVPWSRFVSRGPLMGLYYTFWVRKAAGQLRKRSFDVLYTHGAAAGVLSHLPTNVVCVANPHGMEEFDRSDLVRYCARYAVRRLTIRASKAHRIIATDKALRPLVEDRFRVRSSQVEVIPNAIDLARLDGLSPAHHTRDRDVIVTVGRLVPNKGYDLLLDALTTLVANEWSGRQIRWRHFGHGDETDSLLRAAADAGLDLRIRRDASDQEVHEALSSAGLFVQPSRYEGSSLTTLEAMASGACVVATPVGGIPDKIQDGVTGFLAEDVSAASIVQALVRADSADRSAVGRAARREVEERFDLVAAARQYVDLFTTLADRRSSRTRVVHVVRDFGPGKGVGTVVHQVAEQLEILGYRNVVLSRNDVCLGWRHITTGACARIQLALEIMLFTVMATLISWKRYSKDPHTVVFSHNDGMYGDVHVNHGLLAQSNAAIKLSGFERRLNPIHFFLIPRDYIKYSRLGPDKQVVSINSAETASFRKRFPRSQAGHWVIPNGAPAISTLAKTECSEEQLPRTRTPTLIFVGHEFRRKGLHLIIRALADLTHVDLLVVGGSPTAIAEAKELAAIRGVEHRVFFLGRAASVTEQYLRADLVVLPSAYETGPLVVLEGLAHGLPAITLLTGMAVDYSRAGGPWRTCEADEVSLVSTVNQMLADLNGAKGHEMRSAARSLATELSWAAVSDRYAEVIERAQAVKSSRLKE